MPNRSGLPDERGFALPATVFVVTLLTLLLATGFARVRADRLIATGSAYAMEALAIAQSGLQKYVGTQATRPADGDSVTIIDIPGGYAVVVARVVQRPADTLLPQTYIIRSTGYLVEPTVSSEPLAQRTVAQFAAWQVGYMQATAALAVHPVTRRRSGSPLSTQDTISGIDACLSNPQPPVRSLWTPIHDVPSNHTTYPVTFEPTPPDISWVSDDVDWSSTIGSGIIPDHTSIQVNDNNWTIQRVEGNATLNNGFGTGLLIVTGELDFTGSSASWRGVILVGEDLNLRATENRIEGLVATGLKGGLSSLFHWTDYGDSNVKTVIRYNSCNLLQALEPLTGFTPISNTWIDNWATY